ncbi:uncharacterized protein LOC134217362 isoform X2 [Armigeres subalbatus]|uniref:uncharacterized protein LOC134217362 isoform X2 n=1 Tax=Armigeres subalbatus TaxID=124917 RepID=UPI002ED3194B
MRKVVCAAIVVFLTIEGLARSDSAFITNGKCVQSTPFLWQKNISISADCNCPPNFIALIYEEKKTTFCVMLTKPQEWSNVCISYGTPDDYYEVTVKERKAINSFLRKVNVTEFWISVQRASPYDPPLKMLPGRDWGLPLDFDEDYDLEVVQESSGNCLKVNINPNYSTATYEDCNKKYSHLCVYKRPTMLRLHCPNGAYTTRYTEFQEYCFNIVKVSYANMSKYGLFDVDSKRKFQLYQNLASESDVKCENSIVRSELTYLIQVAQNPVQANENANINDVAMRPDGTMKLTKEFDCIAYQNKSYSKYWKMPDLKLNFDRIHKTLLLVITNGRYLWRDDDRQVGVVCYTDGDTELLKAVSIKRKVWPPPLDLYSDDEDDKNDEQEIYELKLYGDFPGYYWCEGHSVNNFTRIQSERIIAQKKESDVHVYAILLEVYDIENENFWKKNNLKTLMKDYLMYLKLYDNDQVSKLAGLLKGMHVVKIELTNQLLKRTNLIVHVAAKYIAELIIPSLDGTKCSGCEDFVREHYLLKETLNILFATTSNETYRFKGINSTDICLPLDRYNGLNWPHARIGQTIAPLELCLIETSGLPLTRKCVAVQLLGSAHEYRENFPSHE